MKNFPVLLVSLFILTVPCLHSSFSDADGRSPAEQEIWDLEYAYITRLKEADVQGLAVFWHEGFIQDHTHLAERKRNLENAWRDEQKPR